MKSQDVVILLKLVSLEDNEQNAGPPPQPRGLAGGEDPYSVRGLEAALGISKTEVSASLNRWIVPQFVSALRGGNRGAPAHIAIQHGDRAPVG